MEPTDPGQGQEKPSAQDQELTLSSKGRQRKKNPKYSDFETGDKSAVQNTPRKSLRGIRTPSKTSLAKSEEKEATDNAAQESNGKTSEETPKKATRAKKTPSKKTPAKKSPTKKTPVKKTPAKKTPVKKTPAKKTPARKTPNADGLTGEGGAGHAAQQENGKPKRKHVQKQPAQKTLVTEAEEVQGEHAVQPEEAVGPDGRRRRGAATAALKYLQILAKEVFGNPNDDSQPGAKSKVGTDAERKSPKGSKVCKGKKRKRCVSDSNDEDDEDFVPGAEEDEAEEMEEEEEEVDESDLELEFGNVGKSRAVFHIARNTYSNARTSNGLSMKIMGTVWSNFETTKKFREEHYSSWVFPEWVPSTNDWHLVPQSDVEKYLPQELRSAAFKVSREGLGKEETPLQSLNRFEAVPAHGKCWDMLLYAGGPVWAMEWCPTPDGAPATQYIALACHRGMDDRHYVNKTYTEPGLIQLWDVGKMEYNSSPDSQPTLAYGLAQDKGFIWNLKWCPAGGWELPSCGRKAPFLPRLGLLAAASSNGVVTVYSLPHPAALHSNKKLPDSGNVKQQLPIYQSDGVLTLKLGSLKAPRHESSGQVLSMDWLPEKPHNVIAIGFYDGIVGLWDLSTKSTLLQMRESDGSLSLLPYRCLLAHDHAVRALAFCPASRDLLVTGGEDRYIKTWDLKRLDHPITVQKRYLTNDIYWPLNAPGYLMAQDAAYVARGSHGVHFFDHFMQTIYAIPRTGSLWSLSYTDWLNSVVTSDSHGEVIFAILPPISHISPYIKRTIERRFPIYTTSLVPHATTDEEDPEMGAAKVEGEAAEEQEGGEAGEQDPGSEGGDGNDNENGGEGQRGRNNTSPPLQFQTYKEAVKKYCLHHTDSNMRTFVGYENQASWNRMKDMELKTAMNLDEMQLAALHKVRFNPNMSCHTWVVSGGQTGLVKLNCLKNMISPKIKNLISENQAQFNALYSPKDQREEVQTEAEQL